MSTLLRPPRNCSARKNRSGPDSESLTIPQLPRPHTHPHDTMWEERVAHNQGLESPLSKDALAGVKPLPWRQCAALMVLASIAVYGLGFAIVSAFNHLFHYLQL
jgi:hypothetical protein